MIDDVPVDNSWMNIVKGLTDGSFIIDQLDKVMRKIICVRTVPGAFSITMDDDWLVMKDPLDHAPAALSFDAERNAVIAIGLRRTDDRDRKTFLFVSLQKKRFTGGFFSSIQGMQIPLIMRFINHDCIFMIIRDYGRNENVLFDLVFEEIDLLLGFIGVIDQKITNDIK